MKTIFITNNFGGVYEDMEAKYGSKIVPWNVLEQIAKDCPIGCLFQVRVADGADVWFLFKRTKETEIEFLKVNQIERIKIIR